MSVQPLIDHLVTAEDSISELRRLSFEVIRNTFAEGERHGTEDVVTSLTTKIERLCDDLYRELREIEYAAKAA